MYNRGPYFQIIQGVTLQYPRIFTLGKKEINSSFVLTFVLILKLQSNILSLQNENSKLTCHIAYKMRSVIKGRLCN